MKNNQLFHAPVLRSVVALFATFAVVFALSLVALPGVAHADEVSNTGTTASADAQGEGADNSASVGGGASADLPVTIPSEPAALVSDFEEDLAGANGEDAGQAVIPASSDQPVQTLDTTCAGATYTGTATCEDNGTRLLLSSGTPVVVSGTVTAGQSLYIELNDDATQITFSNFHASGQNGQGGAYMNAYYSEGSSIIINLVGTNEISGDINLFAMGPTEPTTVTISTAGSASLTLGGKIWSADVDDTYLHIISGVTIHGDIEKEGTGIVNNQGTIDGNISSQDSGVSNIGTVTGDITTIAGQIVNSGIVSGDVSSSTGDITNEGTVHGDITSSDGDIDNNGTVDGDVFTATGDITNAGTIGGDAIAPDGTVTGGGTVDGSTIDNSNPPATPGTPTNLRATAQDFIHTVVSWNAVPNAKAYKLNVKCDTPAYSPPATINKDFLATTTTLTIAVSRQFEDQFPYCLGDYVFQVTALTYKNISASGGTPSAPLTFTPKHMRLPSEITVDWLWVDATSARITWTTPEDLGYPAVNRYEMWLVPTSDQGTLVCTSDNYFETTPTLPGTTSHSKLCTGLTSGTQYKAYANAIYYPDDYYVNNPLLYVISEASVVFTFKGDNADNQPVDPCASNPTTPECLALTEPDPALTATKTPCPADKVGEYEETTGCDTADQEAPVGEGLKFVLDGALVDQGVWIDGDGTIHSPLNVVIPLTVIHTTNGDDISEEYAFVSTSADELKPFDVITHSTAAADTVEFKHASPHSLLGTSALNGAVALKFEVNEGYVAPTPASAETGVSVTLLLELTLVLLLAGAGVAGVGRSRTRRLH